MYLFRYARTNLKSLSSVFEYSIQMYVYLTPIIICQCINKLKSQAGRRAILFTFTFAIHLFIPGFVL